MKIVNHRLVRDDGTPYPFRLSPNRGTPSNRDAKINHRWLVMHYTAGGDAAESIGWLASSQSKASAHVVIGKDGSITQLVPFDVIAWHAGKSTWKNVNGCNGVTIGIELDGHGYLGTAGPGKWKFGGRTIPDSEVMVATHRFGKPAGGWARYPQRQLEVALELARLLIRTYGLTEVLGHDDISPGRKQDPGPAFDMASFRAAALQQPPSDGAGAPVAGSSFRVTTTLNVRSGPGASNPPVPGSPLAPGTLVRGSGDDDGWKRITAEGSGVNGWVSAEFLEPVPSALFSTTSALNIRGGPSTADAPVPGSPLPAGTIVEGLADDGDWKRVAVQGTVNGRDGIVGWVSARFLQPATVPVGGIGQPVDA